MSMNFILFFFCVRILLSRQNVSSKLSILLFKQLNMANAPNTGAAPFIQGLQIFFMINNELL